MLRPECPAAGYACAVRCANRLCGCNARFHHTDRATNATDPTNSRPSRRVQAKLHDWVAGRASTNRRETSPDRRCTGQWATCPVCPSLVSAVCASASMGRVTNRSAIVTRGLAYGRRALQVAPDDPVTVANAAQTLAFFGEDIRVMIALVDHALRLNPSYARGWLVSGVLRLLAGEPKIAIAHCEAAARLSPCVRIGGRLLDHISGAAYLAQGQFDQAETRLLLAIHDTAEFPDPYRLLASCYAHQGRLDDARSVIQKLRSMTSSILYDFASTRNRSQRELIASGLRLAAGVVPAENTPEV